LNRGDARARNPDHDSRTPDDVGVISKDVTMPPPMLRADELTVVHHDDTVSRFTDVTYTLDRDGLRVWSAAGDEKAFACHEILTTHVRLAHQRRRRLTA
jgi:hypothetical protein